MNAPLVSIIIPMYKVEKYLPDCLDSVVNQTYVNLEIICVNDGSPDNCANIVQSYQQNDPRIVLINKPNGGLSDARNAGIDIAKGEYLFFLDSDDCLDASCIETLVELAQRSHAQISVCQFVAFEGESADFTAHNSFSHKLAAKSYLVYKQSYCQPGLKITLNTAWGKLYSRELFTSARYPVGKINEDEYLTYKLFLIADRACYTDAKLYGYRTRQGSITNSFPAPDEHKLDLVTVYESRIDAFKPTSDVELVSFAVDDFLYQICYFYCQPCDTDFRRILVKLYRKGYRKYHSLLRVKSKIVRAVFYLSPRAYQVLDYLAGLRNSNIRRK